MANIAGIPVKACIAEFVGTFLLIFTVGCNVLSGNATWGAASIACVLMVSIYAFGAVSGGHFNPAVSVALALAKKLDDSGGWTQVAVYSLAQVSGGLAAAVCYANLFKDAFLLAPKAGYTSGAVFCEVVYTFMLCFVVLNTAASKAKGGQNQYFGFAIAFVIVAGGYGAGAVGAGCFNPAVAISIYSSSEFFMIGGAKASICLLYVIAELVGAAIAVALFRLLRPEENDSSSQVSGLGYTYSLQSKLISEVVGTFILVFTVGLNVLGESPAGAFSIAASLACMIYAIGDISGGHFNPAVTMAIQWCGKGVEKKSVVEACQYAGSQVAGAVLGAFSYAFVHGKTFPLGPGVNHDWSSVAVAEFMFTFVLTFVVLGVAIVDSKPASEFTGLIIGSCVTAGGCAIGSISGGCLNPAVSIGVAAAHVLGGGFFVKAFFYAAFQLLGAAASAGVFRIVYANEVEDKEAAQKV